MACPHKRVGHAPKPSRPRCVCLDNKETNTMTNTTTDTSKQTPKPAYKRYRSRRNDLVYYVGGAAFLIGYAFGTGFFVFSIG